MNLILPGEQPKQKPSYLKYDDEFKYSDDLEPKVAEIMQRVEDAGRVDNTSSQAAEEYWRLYEQNVASRKQHRFVDQEELKTHREGRILHMNEFLRLLKSAGLNAWYTEKGGMAGTLGLFANHAGYFSSCNHERNEPHYIGFVQVPFMQEYEELHFDRYNVPLGSKRRGWRTVLLRIIEQRLLTAEQVHEIFEEPVENVMSRRYLHYLKYLRSV